MTSETLYYAFYRILLVVVLCTGRCIYYALASSLSHLLCKNPYEDNQEKLSISGCIRHTALYRGYISTIFFTIVLLTNHRALSDAQFDAFGDSQFDAFNG